MAKAKAKSKAKKAKKKAKRAYLRKTEKPTRTKFEDFLRKNNLRIIDIVQEGKLDVSYQTLSELKTGKRKNPNFETVKKISDFYNVPVSEII